MQIAIIVFLLIVTVQSAQPIGNETINVLPDSNTQTFRVDSRTFWREEFSERMAEIEPIGKLISGGTHPPTGGCVSAPFATLASTNRWNRVQASADGTGGTKSIDYAFMGVSGCVSGTTVARVAVCAVSGNVVGNFNRVPNSNYFLSLTPGAPEPEDCLNLFDATVLNGNIVSIAKILVAPQEWEPFLNVREHGAVGDGVTDDSVTVQAVLDLAKSIGIRSVYFPPGNYLMNQRLLIQNAQMRIFGSGIQITSLLVNNSDGGIEFLSDGAHYLWLHDMTISAHGTGALNRGTALRAAWPGSFATAPYATISNVSIVSQGFNSDPCCNPHFVRGIHLVNPRDVRVTDAHIIQNNNTVGDMIYLENAASSVSARVLIRGLTTRGGANGVVSTGQITNVQMTEFSIENPTFGILMDGDDSVATNSLLFMSHGSIIAKRHGIFTKTWNDVRISNVNVLLAPVPGAEPVTGITIDNGANVSIIGSKLGASDPTTHLLNLIYLINARRFAVSSNIMNLFHSNAAVASVGVAIAPGTQLGVVDGNVIELNGTQPNTRGVLLQPEMLDNDQLAVTNNRFESVEIGISATNINNTMISDNAYLGSGILLLTSGTIGTMATIRDNYPPSPRLTIANNSTTPTIAGAPDGLLIAQNTIPVLITNMLGGYEGRQIEFYGANSNTTLQHNVNIFLNASLNHQITLGSTITLRFIAGAWREIARSKP